MDGIEESLTTSSSLVNTSIRLFDSQLACGYSVDIVNTVLRVIIGVVGFFVNSLALCAILTDRTIRMRPLLVLLVNLSVADLIKVIALFVERAFVSRHFSGPVEVFWTFSSSLVLSSITIYRYFSLRRRKNLRFGKGLPVSVMAATSWILAVFAVLLFVTIEHTVGGNIIHWIDLISNVFIISTLLTSASFASAQTKMTRQLNSVKVTTNGAAAAAINNRRAQREWCMTKMCLGMIIAKVASSFPFLIWNLIVSSPDTVQFVCTEGVLFTVNSTACCTSPLSYIISSRRFRVAVVRSLKKIWKVDYACCLRGQHRKSMHNKKKIGSRILPNNLYSSQAPEITQIAASPRFHQPHMRHRTSTLNGFKIFVVDFNKGGAGNRSSESSRNFEKGFDTPGNDFSDRENFDAEAGCNTPDPADTFSCNQRSSLKANDHNDNNDNNDHVMRLKVSPISLKAPEDEDSAQMTRPRKRSFARDNEDDAQSRKQVKTVKIGEKSLEDRVTLTQVEVPRRGRENKRNYGYYSYNIR